MTDHSDLIDRLRAACVGYPRASIAWPHRILHEAADALSSQSLSLSEAREEIERLKEESERRLKCMDRRAERIIDLWGRVNAAERALGPFAAVANVDIGSDETDEDIFQQPGYYHRAPRITVGDMRRARAALDICKSGLADAPSNPPLSDLSSLRKGAEVWRDAIEDAIEKLNTYRGAAVQTVIDQLEAALVSGCREDGADA